VNYAASENCKGCLLVNSVTEIKVLSEEINRKVKSLLSYFNVSFYNCLKAVQDNNEISNDKDCKALSGYLACFTFGLSNVGRNETKRRELRKILDVALAAIKN